MGANPYARAARLLLALTVFGAIGRQLSIHLSAGYNPVNFFSYFTNLSNLFAAGVLFVSACKPTRTASSRLHIARFMSVVNMTVVGIVFAILLRNVDLGSLRPWINILLHYVMPCAVVIDWLLVPPAAKLPIRHLRLALVFPAMYLLYVVIRGAGTGWHPYPFLNPDKVGGYSGVAAYAAGITLVFVLAGWLLLRIGNARAARRYT